MNLVDMCLRTPAKKVKDAIHSITNYAEKQELCLQLSSAYEALAQKEVDLAQSFRDVGNSRHALTGLAIMGCASKTLSYEKRARDYKALSHSPTLNFKRSKPLRNELNNLRKDFQPDMNFSHLTMVYDRLAK